MKIKDKYFGDFDKMKKFLYMKNLKKKNIINLKAKSTNRNNNIIGNKFSDKKQNVSSNNIFNNQSAYYKNFSDNNSKKTPQNNQYMNVNNYQLLSKKILQSKNNKNFNLSNINSLSFRIKSAKSTQNKSSKYIPNKINPMDIKNKNNDSNYDAFRRNKSPDYISKLKNEYSKTMKKSKMLNHDISFSNKLFTLTKSSYNKAKKVLNKSKLKKVNVVRIIKQDNLEKKKKLLSKYKYIKESSSGNIRLNVLDFIRTPQNKLSYVNDYYKQRHLFKKYGKIFSLEQSTEEINENNIFFDRNKKIKKY